MLNVHELEKRWLRYKIKSFIPYISLFILILVLILFYQFRHTIILNHAVKNISEENGSLIIKTDTNKTKRAYQDLAKPTHKEDNKTNENKIIKLKPSMKFIQNLESLESVHYHESSFINKSKRVTEQKGTKQQIEAQDYPKVVQEQNKARKLIIKRAEAQNDLQEIIKRFKNNKNPALGLFIAKKYYENGNYAQSYNYALITNELNKDIEKSWLIFAKSLVKLNKKEDAIKMLKNYINYSHSSNARILLNDIKTGKFK